jgi:SSS family solute:Na+ symporter
MYTVMGGITAVICTDVIQSLALFAGTGIIFCMLVQEGNVSIVDSLAPLKEQGKLDPLNFDFEFTIITTVWSEVITVSLFHKTVCGTNLMMVQRILTIFIKSILEK